MEREDDDALGFFKGIMWMFVFYVYIITLICFMSTGCQVPQSIKKSDPKVYDEMQKSRDSNIEAAGKQYRKHSNKAIKKVGDKVGEWAD